MKRITIREMEERAKKVLQESKTHNMMFFCEIEEDGVYSLEGVVPFFDEEEKRMIVDSVSKLIQLRGVEKYWHITEAWLSTADGSKPYTQPRNDPDRKECLIISEYTKTQENKMCMIPFTKDDKGDIIFAERMETDKMDSRWNLFVEPEGYENRMDEHIKLMNEKFIRNMSKKIANKFNDKFKEVQKLKKENTPEYKIKAKELINSIIEEAKKVKEKNIKLVEDDATE